MKQRSAGFTLVELLISMGIFAIIMTAIMAFLATNQNIAFHQQARTIALTDARSTASYLAETLSQAIYVYPKNIKIKVKIANATKEFTTGERVIAFLTQNSSLICETSAECKYNLNLIFLDARSNYANQIANISRSGSPTVIVSGITPNDVFWPKNVLPSKDWTGAGNLILGIQAEDVDNNATKLFTNDSGFAGYAATDDAIFNGGYLTSGVTPIFTQENALINKIAFTVAIQPASNNANPVIIRGSAMGRNIPRAN